jgi:glycosyltransferase involved in cell wall biosynthesis
MRLLVYTDYVYTREGGAVYAPRAFALFVSALRRHVDGLVVAGRLHPEERRSHYRLPDDVEFLPLPHYGSAASLPGLAAAAASSLRRFDRALRSADAAWVLGPQGLALVLVANALARRRHVVLGVRQDLPSYARSRYPGRRGLHFAGDLLDRSFRLLARRLPVAVVGRALGERYSGGRAVLPLTVSLVSQSALDEPAPERPWEDASELVALSVGRLEEEKNPLMLADVLARLRAADPRWRLRVCGEGPLAGALEKRLAALGLADAAELLGYVPVEDGLPELYRCSHAFLHVSWTEGLPQVVYEAFAARLPLVATGVGGVREAVEGAALVVAPGDPDAAASRIGELAADPALRRRLTAAGLDRVREHTLEAETERLARFIAEAARA